MAPHVFSRRTAASLTAARAGFLAFSGLLGCHTLGCQTGVTVPDPKSAAQAWAEAAERGDADAMHGMLTKKSQAELGKAEVSRIVKESGGELKDHAALVRKAADKHVTVAVLPYADGTSVALTLEGGAFRVANAGFVPGGGATPEQAATTFHDVLKKRSYPGILRLLSPTLRAAVEGQLKGLETALDQPGWSVTPSPNGNADEAEIKLQDGHRIKLKKIGEVWYIDNFE